MVRQIEGKRGTVLYTGGDKSLEIETNRTIRKLMDIIERYTNYPELEEDKKAIVRDTVLNQINRLARVAKHKQTMVFGK